VTKSNVDMAWRCSGNTNKELIDNLFKGGLITSSRVRDAMMKVSSKSLYPMGRSRF
jgi:protein-L-isoaspartate(D-aspartate) O-methyltransferase